VYDTTEEKIREKNGHQPSVDDQVKVVPWFNRHGYTVPDEEKARTSTVREGVRSRVDHDVRDILDNLENIGVLELTEPPGTDKYIRHHRTEENFFPGFDAEELREMQELLIEERSRLLEDVREQSSVDQEGKVALPDGGDRPVGEVIAERIEQPVSGIERWLMAPEGLTDQMSRFDTAVKAIDDSDEAKKGRNYEAMGWRSVSLKWALSEADTARMRNHSLQ
jgi:hypothetical protein